MFDHENNWSIMEWKKQFRFTYTGGDWKRDKKIQKELVKWYDPYLEYKCDDKHKFYDDDNEITDI